VSGKAAHAAGAAHQSSSAEATDAARKGGTAPHLRRGRGRRTPNAAPATGNGPKPGGPAVTDAGAPRAEEATEETFLSHSSGSCTKEQAESIRAKDRAVLAMAIALDVTDEPMTTARGTRWLRTMKIAIRDEHGVARHLLDISEGITPQREMAATLRRTEEQFRQAQKMEAIGKLAGGVAHDFNNMLSIVLSYAELARKTVSDPETLASYLTEIVMAATGAAELTKQLLAFSRQQVAQPRILDINEALARMDTMFRRVLEEDVELRAAPAPDLWTVSADPTQIDQILMNLIVNARDAMPAGGALTIETANVELDQTYAAAHVGAKPGPHVMLAVSDEGTGMDAPTMAQIFEPFFTTKALGEGTGLGLSTVYGIVRQSGGSSGSTASSAKGPPSRSTFHAPRRGWPRRRRPSPLRPMSRRGEDERPFSWSRTRRACGDW
jgi:signal transduction histidine kinase